MTIDRRALIGGAALLGLNAPALAGNAEREHRPREDWPWLGRYAVENAVLKAAGTRVDIVFMGDSITEGWLDKRPGFFLPGRLNRGIGGQTTPQMLLRIMADVVALRPRAVHIMAGTNDIAGNTGPITEAQTQDNLAAMIQLAKAHGIQVLLASIPPAARFPWRPGLETVLVIQRLNAWSRAYAGQVGITWVDYLPVLATPTGAMRSDLTYDGVHPDGAGYDVMAGVLEPILERLLPA